MEKCIVWKRSKKYIFWTLLIVGLCACDSGRLYENNVLIPKDGWFRADRARFEVEITDTISGYDILINVRNNSNYKYMELWLFIDSYAPTGNVQRDTMKIMLADYQGKWLGNGLGDKFDNRVMFHKNVRFPVSGVYAFEYEQAMRDEPLKGIDDIGLRIEQSHP